MKTNLTANILEVNNGYPFYSSSYCVCTFANSISATINCANCILYPFRKYSLIIQCENSVGISNSPSNIISKVITTMSTCMCTVYVMKRITVILFITYTVHNCSCFDSVHMLTEPYYTGTHRIQNTNIINIINVSNSSILLGTVVASCHITTNHEDMITGCLAIIISSNRSELPVYKLMHLSRNDSSVSLNVTIKGLGSDSNYRVYLFETLGSLLLPVKFPATTESFQLPNSQHSTKEGVP